MAGGKKKPAPCEVKPHFDCDGTGQKCNDCGESEAACRCDESNLSRCDTGCDGTGRLCVEHDSPCGDLSMPARCDAVKGETPFRGRHLNPPKRAR